jgi:heptaprenyl diphosphate synthase
MQSPDNSQTNNGVRAARSAQSTHSAHSVRQASGNKNRRTQRERIRRLSRTALYLALALTVHVLESVIFPPLPIPGVRLGLANMVILTVLYTDGFKTAGIVSISRVFLGSFFSGTFLGIAFWPTLAGAITSTLVMAAMRYFFKSRVSPVGVSVMGALAHNISQLAAIYPFFPNAGLLYYLPFLILLAVPAGIITGVIARNIIAALNPSSAMEADAAQP